MKMVEVRKFTEDNIGKFKIDLMLETWNDVLNCNEIDIAYQWFLETLTNYLNINKPKSQI